MDMNEYAMEYLVRDHLSTLRKAARQRALWAPAAGRAALRVRLGDALVHAGEWLRGGGAGEQPSPATHG
jgi:hypothetical protein